ncbi:MAG: UDP-2,3-diacylglucosamine diphosphatase [Deltaproteobacteria bacterium]|nr:UDP-2,3-diacylglucosamine diphosphatase [Deltaproteobacteria bacterium]MBW1871401.1 UDP-2,3-diacylglucosamine diphosphatase [Deltaproteobacteria bacterium]
MTASKQILFIADAHLRGRQDNNQGSLVRFLNQIEPVAGGLIVVGDLFDFLAGKNQAAAEAYAPVLEAMQRFAPYHYIEGNHDFDLSSDIPGLAGAIIQPAPVTLTLNGFVFRLLHGDRTSPTDFGTRLLRRGLQSLPIRFARDYLLPDKLIFRFALAFATFSRHNTWPGRVNEANSARQAALEEGMVSGADVVVYAHTHQPLLEKTRQLVIANTGAALAGGSYLSLNGDTLCLCRFPDGEILPPGPVQLKHVVQDNHNRSNPTD